ncbi:MAG: YdcF family protein [Alphaproteobacteria bacterium]
MTRTRARTLGTGIVLALALAAAWLGGLLWFGAGMPRHIAEPGQPTEAIVVLTGGAERLAEGGRLLRSASAGWLFVSGVNIGVAKPTVLRIAGITKPRLIGSVVLGYQARNTRQNARETARWLRKKGFTSIRLVTANYHMRRAMLEFRRVLPKARIVSHPVFPKPVNPGPWWQNMTAISVVAGEYNKFLVALLGGGGPRP